MNIHHHLPRAWTAGTAALLLTLSATAQTTNIIRGIGSYQYELMSFPLLTATSNHFPSIASNAPNLSWAWFFDASNSAFISSQKSGKGAWDGVAQAKTILPDDCFFFRPATNFEIAFTGTIPDSPFTNQVHDRLSALAYPFPDPVLWTDTSLASNLPMGSLVYFWNLDRQQYDVYRKAPPAKGGWGPASNHVVQPGDGFFVRQPPGSAPFLWIQERRN